MNVGRRKIIRGLFCALNMIPFIAHDLKASGTGGECNLGMTRANFSRHSYSSIEAHDPGLQDKEHSFLSARQDRY